VPSLVAGVSVIRALFEITRGVAEKRSRRCSRILLDSFLSPCKDQHYANAPPDLYSHDPFNAAVKDGTAGQKLGRIVDEIKPEAIYFTEQHGQRGAIMIVEMADPSKIPALAEPWFLTFNASVEFRVVMTPDDLQKAGLDEVGRKWA